eukprot:TRINITY_DN1811_c0_g2_i1.p1 TRINITY_DN1811_c0_g2~~TRINITY_DN1811_c0_g2_i1.p1  ORF type:complete len:719 (+),score=118.44 TRINITY_DN1811_c0_g2_i1:115-2271(+)
MMACAASQRVRSQCQANARLLSSMCEPHAHPAYGVGAYKSATKLATNAPMRPLKSSPFSKVNSWTEWQPLKEIIVGRCELSCVPANEPAFEAKLRHKEHALLGVTGLRSEEAIANGEEEIAGLVATLEKHGVTVRRPEVVDWTQSYKTPDFEVPCGNTGAMPRDVLLTVGNEILEAPMSWRSRFFEYRAYRELLNEYFEGDPNFIWSAAPKPTMKDSLYHTAFPHEAKGDAADQKRAILAEKRLYVHTESEPIFDAADVMRVGRDLFVCNSYTTNRKGYDWLRRHFNGKGLRVHFFDFPDDTAPMHLDVNFVPLNGNTVVLNPARPPRPWVERMLRENGWNIIRGKSNGIPPPPMSQCSEWLALNVLSIDEKRVLVEAQEIAMMDTLSAHGFEPIPVNLRGIAEFGGAFHCCTADVYREGSLESYFPHIDELQARGLDCQFAPYGADAPEVYSKVQPVVSVPAGKTKLDIPFFNNDTKRLDVRAYSAGRSDAVPPVQVITDTQRKVLGCPDYTDELASKWSDSEIQIDENELKIQGHPVMEAWETPYMARLAEIATSKGGKVLELGFGMAISATFVQSHPIDEHWIVEANKNVAGRAHAWAEASAKSKVVINEGFSWNVTPKFPDGSFDGILYDTYPIKAGAANRHHLDFFEEAARLLRPGGIFTYFCNEDVDLSAEERALLEKAGFDVTTEKVNVPTPDDCQYWRAKTIVAPTCVKR